VTRKKSDLQAAVLCLKNLPGSVLGKKEYAGRIGRFEPNAWLIRVR